MTMRIFGLKVEKVAGGWGICVMTSFISQTEERDMGGAYRTYERGKTCTQNIGRKLGNEENTC
jgi:hypothetical protein